MQLAFLVIAVVTLLVGLPGSALAVLQLLDRRSASRPQRARRARTRQLDVRLSIKWR